MPHSTLFIGPAAPRLSPFPVFCECKASNRFSDTLEHAAVVGNVVGFFNVFPHSSPTMRHRIQFDDVRPSPLRTHKSRVMPEFRAGVGRCRRRPVMPAIQFGQFCPERDSRIVQQRSGSRFHNSGLALGLFSTVKSGQRLDFKAEKILRPCLEFELFLEPQAVFRAEQGN